MIGSGSQNEKVPNYYTHLVIKCDTNIQDLYKVWEFVDTIDVIIYTYTLLLMMAENIQ